MLKSKDLEIDRLRRQLAASNQVIDKQADTLAALRTTARRGSRQPGAANPHKIVTESDLSAIVNGSGKANETGRDAAAPRSPPPATTATLARTNSSPIKSSAALEGSSPTSPAKGRTARLAKAPLKGMANGKRVTRSAVASAKPSTSAPASDDASEDSDPPKVRNPEAMLLRAREAIADAFEPDGEPAGQGGGHNGSDVGLVGDGDTSESEAPASPRSPPHSPHSALSQLSRDSSQLSRDSEQGGAEADHEDEDDFLHGSRIHVVVRKRPPRSDGDTDVVDCAPPRCVVHEPKKKVDLTEYVHPHEFLFDDSFGAEADTTDVYRRSVHSLVHNLFQGGTSTCFCFGETASGKTYTLFGECGTVGGAKGDTAATAPSSPEGLYMMAARRIFDEAADASSPGQDGVLEPGFAGGIGVSMFEIYGQKVFDLLNGSNALTALEDAKGVLQLVGLSRHYCDDIDTFMAKTSAGRAARSTSSTGANQTSSRSHAVMAVYLLNREHMVQDGSGVSYTPDNAVEVVGKLSLIDLAGSERGVDNAETDKTTRMEGRQINTSLLALKEVIRSLEGKRSHAPFRQSRLTQVLQESLTGNLCQTVVVACISAALENCQQTLNTLRYAEGLKKRKRRKSLTGTPGGTGAATPTQQTPSSMVRSMKKGPPPTPPQAPWESPQSQTHTRKGHRRSRSDGHGKGGFSLAAMAKDALATPSSSQGATPPTPTRTVAGRDAPTPPRPRGVPRLTRASSASVAVSAASARSDSQGRTASRASTNSRSPSRSRLRRNSTTAVGNTRSSSTSASPSRRSSSVSKIVTGSSTTAVAAAAAAAATAADADAAAVAAVMAAPFETTCPRAGEGRHALKLSKAIPRPGEMACTCSMCNRVVVDSEVFSCRLCKPWYNVCQGECLGPVGSISVRRLSSSLPVTDSACDAIMDPRTPSVYLQPHAATDSPVILAGTTFLTWLSHHHSKRATTSAQAAAVN